MSQAKWLASENGARDLRPRKTFEPRSRVHMVMMTPSKKKVDPTSDLWGHVDALVLLIPPFPQLGGPHNFLEILARRRVTDVNHHGLTAQVRLSCGHVDQLHPSAHLKCFQLTPALSPCQKALPSVSMAHALIHSFLFNHTTFVLVDLGVCAIRGQVTFVNRPLETRCKLLCLRWLRRSPDRRSNIRLLLPCHQCLFRIMLNAFCVLMFSWAPVIGAHG